MWGNKFSRGLILALSLIAIPTLAWAQSSVIPYVTNGQSGTGAFQYCVVGTVATGSCPMPVTVSGGTSGGATHAQTSVLATTLVAKASPGNLYSFQVSADSTLSSAAWWLMVYDATSAPTSGTVTPAKCFAYPSGTTSASYGFGTPVAFTTGISLSVSTTGCFTQTNSTHAFIAADFE